ncbi:MAG: LEA type 2 family protein [Nitrospiraceae bacterium]|nr:LEA type 2 family protein [Nitrospiraceae bacterium]
MHRIQATLLLVALLLLPGCASWLMKGEPPEVLVTNVTPLEASAFEQRLKVDLRLRNPNDFDLKVTGIDFRLDLNGNRLARGLGNQDVLVPRLGEAIASVSTSTSTLDVFRQFMAFSPDRPVTYTIKGILHTGDGRLPFESSGVLLEKGPSSDAPAGQ